MILPIRGGPVTEQKDEPPMTREELIARFIDPDAWGDGDGSIIWSHHGRALAQSRALEKAAAVLEALSLPLVGGGSEGSANASRAATGPTARIAPEAEPSAAFPPNGFSPSEQTPEYWLGLSRGLTHALAIVRGKVGDLTYYERFWPARHTAKRRLLEVETRQLRELDFCLDGWLRLAQGFHGKAVAKDLTPTPLDAAHGLLGSSRTNSSGSPPAAAKSDNHNHSGEER